MNDPLPALAERSPLLSHLDAHFTEDHLRTLLGTAPAEVNRLLWARGLQRPLQDFLARPGKEFRANLVRTSYRLAGGKGSCPDALPWIVEILHAGSLIVDDIQDESTTRRGRPALHCEFGLPVALNVGNFMYFWAFTLVEHLPIEPRLQLQCYRVMSRLVLACHHGQSLDLTANVRELAQADVRAAVQASTELKTGALMELAACLGAVAADAGGDIVQTIATFGRRLGVGLQMLDDVGGLLTERHRHKGHEDLLEGRPTWPWGWLAAEMPAARYSQLRELSARVQAREEHPEVLGRALRRHLNGSGRMRVRRALQRAFTDLRDGVGASPSLDALRSEIRRLEKSYG